MTRQRAPSSSKRMCVPARRAHLTEIVDEEITRLRALRSSADERPSLLERFLDTPQLAELDPFDRVQLEHVVEVARRARSLSEAGRMLFTASRRKRRA